MKRVREAQSLISAAIEPGNSGHTTSLPLLRQFWRGTRQTLTGCECGLSTACSAGTLPPAVGFSAPHSPSAAWPLQGEAGGEAAVPPQFTWFEGCSMLELPWPEARSAMAEISLDTAAGSTA